MKQNLSPAVTGIIVAVVLIALIVWGYKATGPQHEMIDKPIDMGKVMGGNKAGPPPTRGGNPMSPSSSGAPTTP